MSIKSLVLVDGDNIGCNAWVFLLTTLTENDGLILFYTDKSPSLTIGTLEKIINSEYPIFFVHCQMGTNALDFQLSSYLGFLIAQEPHKEYAILSNDNGYDVVVSFWKRSGYTVRQIRSTDLQEMKRSFLRLTTMDNPLEELETLEVVEDPYTAVDSLLGVDDHLPIILCDQNSQKNIFYELLFIFNRKPSPINSAIDAFSPDGKRCDTMAHSSFEPEGWHVEEDGNKWLLVVDGYEIYSYYQGDPSWNGDWSSSRTKACCYVEISFDVDDQGMSYAVKNIDYPEAY